MRLAWQPRTGEPGAATGPLVALAGLFVLSGATGLAAQVVLQRLLSYVFGSGHEATAVTLAAFMTGLAAGAFAASRLSPGLRRPLRAWALLELGVGLCLAIAPLVFPWLMATGPALARAVGGDGLAVTAVRFALSFLFVAIPTLLMGATLPTLLCAFPSDASLALALPRLYAANATGAAFGALVSAYVGIPWLGLDGTLWAAAVVNAGVAIAGLALARRATAPTAGATVEPRPPQPATGLGVRAGATLAFLQGFAFFCLEVTWTHLIGTAIGVTVYAFALMLAAILAGIAAGSVLLPVLRRAARVPDAALFALLQGAFGLSLLLLLPLWDRFPDVIRVALALRPDWGFGAREALRFAWVALLVAPPAFACGASLPALISATRLPHSAGETGGALLGANTLGALAGSLITSHVLLGRVDSGWLMAAVAAGAGLVGALALRSARGVVARAGPRMRAIQIVLAGLPALAVAAAWSFAWDPLRLTSGSHYYWTAPDPAQQVELLSFAEDAQSGFVSVERAPDGTRIMKTNGKYEGSDAVLEFQDHLAYLGALYARRLERGMLVGLGPGRALALLHEMPFRRLDVAEFSPAVADAARTQFPHLVGPALADVGRVHLVIDDGRNQIQLASVAYDYVCVAITGAAFAGVGSVYTREFFESVRARLGQDGVFVLWLQLHHVRDREVRSVLATLREVFAHVHAYATPAEDQGYLVASAQELVIDAARARALSANPRAFALLHAAELDSLLDLASLAVITTDAELARVLESGPFVRYTDFRPLFEYFTPYGLAEPPTPIRLSAFSAGLLPRFEPALPEADRSGLLGLRALVRGDVEGARAHLRQAVSQVKRPAWEGHLRKLDQLAR